MRASDFTASAGRHEREREREKEVEVSARARRVLWYYGFTTSACVCVRENASREYDIVGFSVLGETHVCVRCNGS